MIRRPTSKGEDHGAPHRIDKVTPRARGWHREAVRRPRRCGSVMQAWARALARQWRHRHGVGAVRQWRSGHGHGRSGGTVGVGVGAAGSAGSRWSATAGSRRGKGSGMGDGGASTRQAAWMINKLSCGPRVTEKKRNLDPLRFNCPDAPVATTGCCHLESGRQQRGQKPLKS